MTREQFIKHVLLTLQGDCVAASNLLNWGCRLLPDGPVGLCTGHQTDAEAPIAVMVCQRCGKKTTDHRSKYCEVGDDPQGKNEHRWVPL